MNQAKKKNILEEKRGRIKNKKKKRNISTFLKVNFINSTQRNSIPVRNAVDDVDLGTVKLKIR
jgi:hypothetical protein